MYDTFPQSPLKGEARQLWPENIIGKELETLFDLDPTLEESLDFSELDTAYANSDPVGGARVPDSAVVHSPVATGESLLTLTAADTTEHLAQLESQAFTAVDHGAVPAASPVSLHTHHHHPTSPPSVSAVEAVSTFSTDVLMPEFASSQVPVSAPPASSAAASQGGGGEWAQAPFYATVKMEDLTACSLEASLPGYTFTTTSTTSSVCKPEPLTLTLDDSCSEYSNLSPRSCRSLSESSTAASLAPDSPRGGRPSKGGRSRRRQVPKDSEEYKEKRVRNNIAVRKSRAKAKEKQRMTEGRVKELMDINESLQKRLEMLTKEVTVLKGLFINVGASLPEDFSKLMEVS